MNDWQPWKSKGQCRRFMPERGLGYAPLYAGYAVIARHSQAIVAVQLTYKGLMMPMARNVFCNAWELIAIFSNP